MARIHNINKSLKEIDRVKNDFIVNISRDFRVPLTVIFNLAELNLSDKASLPPAVREDIDVIYKTSFKFLSKINTLLDLTKLETTGLKLNISKINPCEFVTVITEYHRSLLRNTGIEINTQLPENDPGMFYTDVEKLEDIINNIMSNAVKAVDELTGKITISLESPPESSKIRIRIKDNGTGIDRNDLEKIFSRFSQGDDSVDLIRYRSSGIGLDYCRQLAQQLGGSISAESEGPGKGSVFIVSLDRMRFSEADADREKNGSGFIPRKMIFDVFSRITAGTAVIIGETNRQNEFDSGKGLILVADDDKNVREIILRYLKNGGYHNFVIADNGESAFDMFCKYHPDLVITDYRMPGMMGDEFHRKVCDDVNNALVPFIYVSAAVDERMTQRCKDLGAADILLKPINREQLLDSVNYSLKKYMNIVKITAIDELTRFYNRRVFRKTFESLLLNPAVSDISIIGFDLDHFKNVNDTYGHQAGDIVLSSVCAAVLRMIRSQDIAVRFGGEEFGILLPETRIEHAMKVAEKLRDTVEKLVIEYGSLQIRITASFGVSSLSQCGKKAATPEEKLGQIDVMIKMADEAMYRAKSARCLSCGFTAGNGASLNSNSCPECGALLRAGRNRVEVYGKKAQA